MVYALLLRGISFSGRLVSQAPMITISIPAIESHIIGSLLKTFPKIVPTIGVKYVGIMLRTAPVRLVSNANRTNANPVPSTPSKASAPSAGHANVERETPHNPNGRDSAQATSST